MTQPGPVLELAASWAWLPKTKELIVNWLSLLYLWIVQSVLSIVLGLITMNFEANKRS